MLFAACSDQAEGERCDTRNTRLGSDDCQPGLICVPGADLGSSGANYCVGTSGLVTTCGVCCPEDRANATTSVCLITSTLPGADAAPPFSGTDAGDAAAEAPDSSSTGDDAAGDDASSDASDGSSVVDADADADAGDASDAADDGPG